MDDYKVAGGSSGAKPIAKDQVASELSRAVCEGIAPCCKDAGYAYDVEACKVRSTDSFVHQFVPPDGTADVSYDAQAASDCIALIEHFAPSCGQLTSEVEVSEACADIWVGSRVAGAPCEHDAQCAHTFGAQTVCDALADGDPTVCIDEPRGRRGVACSWTCTGEPSGTSCYEVDSNPWPGSPTTAHCYTNDGLYCNESGVCRPLVFVGGSCSGVTGGTGESGCPLDTYCDGQSCQPRVAAGSPCPNHVECDDGSYCNDSGTCTAKLPQGSACTSEGECLGSCGEGRCVDTSRAIRMFCSAS